MSARSRATNKIAGTVEAIYVAPSAGEPMQPLPEVEAIAGQGLAGDRYREGTGYYSNRPLADGSREITLIEAEVLEKLARGSGVRLDPSESRRNVLTRSIRVNDLIGERFHIGEVVCEGIRICEPCTYLEKLTGKRVMRPLVHEGGLRARIVCGGTVKVGDGILVSSGKPAMELDPASSVQRPAPGRRGRGRYTSRRDTGGRDTEEAEVSLSRGRLSLSGERDRRVRSSERSARSGRLFGGKRKGVRLSGRWRV